AGASSIWLAARTTTMTAPAKTALLVLLDTAPGEVTRDVPFGAGIHSSRADYALLLTGERGWVANMATGSIAELPAGSVATNPAGYENAVEANVPSAALGALPTGFGVAAATGIADPAGQPALED